MVIGVMYVGRYVDSEDVLLIAQCMSESIWMVRICGYWADVGWKVCGQ